MSVTARPYSEPEKRTMLASRREQILSALANGMLALAAREETSKIPRA